MPSLKKIAMDAWYAENRNAVSNADPNGWIEFGKEVKQGMMDVGWKEVRPELYEAIAGLSMPKTVDETKKPTDLPTEARSCLIFYAYDERENIKAAPQFRGLEEQAQELMRRWAACHPTTKQKFEILAAKDKERYELALKAYGDAATGHKKSGNKDPG